MACMQRQSSILRGRRAGRNLTPSSYIEETKKTELAEMLQTYTVVQCRNQQLAIWENVFHEERSEILKSLSLLFLHSLSGRRYVAPKPQIPTGAVVNVSVCPSDRLMSMNTVLFEYTY